MTNLSVAELAAPGFEDTIRSKATELKNELIRQTIYDLDSWKRAGERECGRDFSGCNQVTYDDVLAKIHNEYYAWVEPAFERYLTPHPNAINPMVDALRTIEGRFGGITQDSSGNMVTAGGGLARISDVRTEMGYWEGDLQGNFLDTFLMPLTEVSINQPSVVQVVQGVLRAHQEIHLQRRQSINDLVHKAIEAVRTLNNGRDPKPYIWGTLAGIAGGTVLSLVPGLHVVGAAIIAGSTLAQGFVPEVKAQTTDLGAPTAQEVAAKVIEAMRVLDSSLLDEEGKVKASFDGIRATIAGSRESCIARNVSGPLTVATPLLSTAKPREITDGSLRPRRDRTIVGAASAG